MLFLAGAEAARYAVFYDQVMTFVIYAVGLSLVIPGGLRRSCLELLRSPALWALVAGVALGRSGWTPPAIFLATLSWIGVFTAPVALLAVGLDLKASLADMARALIPATLRFALGIGAAVLAIALFAVIAPRLGAAAFADPALLRMLIIQGLMPSAVFAAVLPARYGFGSPQPAALVLLTTLLCPLVFLCFAPFLN